jgi:hypothetical protein
MTPQGERGWRWHIGAFCLYTAFAILFVDHGPSLTANILGRGADSSIFIWCLAWWPWAVAHHLSLFHTNLMWQPVGVYTPWVTSIPLLALLGLPVTWIAGPVLSYNLLVIASPALAAWCAYRLCLYVSQSVPAALIGGYLYGFSAYEMSQDLSALNLAFSIFVPLLLLAVLRRLNDEIGRARTVALATLLLVAQFLVSVEVFALVFVFGGMAWLFALLYLPARRAALRRLFVDGLITGVFVTLLLSPWLFTMAAHAHYLNLPTIWPYYFTADLANLLLPGAFSLLGGGLFHHMDAHLLGDFQEQDSYLGLPLVIILVLFFRRQRKTPSGRFLLAVLLACLIASFGPRLWVYGVFSNIALPWEVFVHLPLLGAAIPARFALFVALATAIIAALWMAQPARAGWRFGLGVAACLALVPKPHPVMKIPHSAFFQPGRVQAVLGPNPRLLILPFAINGASSFWQQESGFSFTQAGGYLGFPPAAMQIYPAVHGLFGGSVPDAEQIKTFALATATQYIIAGPGTSAALLAALAQLHWKMQQTDDVTIYTVPGQNDPSHG